MRHVAMNSASQVEAVAVAADLFAANQPRPHGASKTRRQRVRGRNLVRIDDVAQVSRRQRFNGPWHPLG